MGEIRIIPVASQYVFLDAVKVQTKVIKEFGLRRKETRSWIQETGSYSPLYKQEGNWAKLTCKETIAGHISVLAPSSFLENTVRTTVC